ncbi:hypothetical protein RND81_07G147100 [Saponaria officinalis]
MASVAAAPPPPPLPAARVMDQKVAAFSQEFHQQSQQQLKQPHQQSQQPNNSQEALRCPRCDSSNTKFCYYNNYSLSQPRHFCKACKRYWTRGGTLRSVPVGGGCRKNKRVKRHPNNSSSSSANNITTNNNTTNNNNFHEGSVNSLPAGVGVGGGSHIHDLISSPSNPLFYNSDHNNLMNFPFSRYDLQNPPQINGFGLGFSSGLVHNLDGHGFRDLISSYPTNTTTTTTTTSTTPPTISSFLASTFQMKGSGGGGGSDGGPNNFQTILPSYEDGGHGSMFKDVKMEFEGRNRTLDHQWSGSGPNQMDQHQLIGSSPSDPSLIWGNGPNLGAWLDPSNNHNLGSSLTSLI